MLASRECDLARAIRAIEARSSALASAMRVDATSDANASDDDETLRKLEQSVNEAKRALRSLANDDERFMENERRVAYVDAIERADREVSAARHWRDARASRGASGATPSGKTTLPRGQTDRVVGVEDSAVRESRRSRAVPGRSVAPVVTTVMRRAPATKTLTTVDEGELRRQRAIQEGLTDELTELASGLKANALALERGLGRSTAVLEDIETRLERNVAGARQTTRRQTAAYRANRRGSCWTWMILAFVGVLFAWTYVAIKLSSDRTKIKAKN